MKWARTKGNSRQINLCAVCMGLFGALLAGIAHGQVLVGYSPGSPGVGNGKVAEYTPAGGLVNDSFITGLSTPRSVVREGENLYTMGSAAGWLGKYTLAGTPVDTAWGFVTGGFAMDNDASGNLYVANASFGRVEKYSTTGGPGNASLITGLGIPLGIAVGGGHVYVANYVSGTVGKYTTSGAVVNASLISGLETPQTIAIDDNGYLYVGYSWSAYGLNKIGKYDTNGNVINDDLIVDPSNPTGMAVWQDELYVAYGTGSVGRYTTSGGEINRFFINGLDNPSSITVIPEPATLATAGVLLVPVLLRRRRFHKRRLTGERE